VPPTLRRPRRRRPRAASSRARQGRTRSRAGLRNEDEDEPSFRRWLTWRRGTVVAPPRTAPAADGRERQRRSNPNPSIHGYGNGGRRKCDSRYRLGVNCSYYMERQFFRK
jgi:hypothetical protein